MKRINTYGMNIKGLRKASGETQNYTDDTRYEEIFYNRETGEVWTKFQYSIGQCSWTQYQDPAIIKICNTSRHMTMQQIADRIHEATTI